MLVETKIRKVPAGNNTHLRKSTKVICIEKICFNEKHTSTCALSGIVSDTKIQSNVIDLQSTKLRGATGPW
jgi:hypothetical protein